MPALIYRILLLLLLALPMLAGANGPAYTYSLNARCQQAYDQFMALQSPAGLLLARQEMLQDPYNLMATYVADYDDFFTLALNGDPSELERRRPHFDQRLSLLSQGDATSPWHRYCKAGLHLRWAIIYFRFGERLKAATNFRRSFLLLQDNKQRFPDFRPNDIFLGLEEAIVGTIPDDYKWLASVLGLRGDVRRGIGRLDRYLALPQARAPFREEALLMHCYLRFYLLQDREATWQLVSSPQFMAGNSLLRAFVKTNLALNNRRADAALSALEQARRLPRYERFPVFEYEWGNALMLKLQPSCTTHFKQYVRSNKGGWYNRDAYQKMALMAYLEGRQDEAVRLRRQIASLPAALPDADKQALRFSRGADWPLPALLRARLLVDGGYPERALAQLESLPQSQLSDAAHRLEYVFRMGRVYEELGQEAKAISCYQAAISQGRGRPEHFGARAALQLGMMHEQAGRKAAAIGSYRQCLAMKGHDYQSSIDQQAKAGLDRLGVKP